MHDRVLAVTRGPVDAATVLGRLDRMAALQPDRPALRRGPRTLDYAQLAERTTNLARRLVGAGVRLGDVVAVRAVDRFDQA